MMIRPFGFRKKMWKSSVRSTLIVGKRGTGKSTILAMIAQEAIAAGYTVYSNYPIDGTIKIPTKTMPNGMTAMNKEFLYNNELLKKSYILLDEAENIWNNRSWGKWTADDSDFLNYIRKMDIYLFCAVQNYENLDLNVRRKVEATWFLKNSILPNCTVVECDFHDICKVEKLDTHVMDSGYHQVSYEPCEFPDGKYWFFRKKWYKYFLTLYMPETVPRNWDLEYWHDLAFREVTEDDSILSADSG